LVLFSDDIANVAEDNDKLQLIYWYLSQALAWFNMKFDTSKFSFFRFGNCDIEEIKLVGLDTRVYTLK
jgi:hypothetical protein